MEKEKKPWVLTRRRRESLKKAQAEHVRLVHVGESVDKRYKARHGGK